MTSVPLPQERLAARETTEELALFSVGWHHAVFEHYRVRDETNFSKLLPTGFELDHYDGSGYMSIVSFQMVGMKLFESVPIPFIAKFPQINIRVYVHRDGKPGVFFLRNYVSNRLASWGGKFGYAMPYRYQPIETKVSSTNIHYSTTFSDSRHHQFSGRIANSLQGHEDDPSSLLFFLVERYPLYSTRGIRLCESRMVHRPWKLHEVDVETQTHAIIDQLGLSSLVEPLQEVLYSPGVDVKMWGPSVLY